MQVTLIDYTGNGHIDPARRAANILIFTRSTRLNMQPSLMAEIEQWSEDKIIEELKYMSNTLPSSWEFVYFTFLINDVTRAFTHQLVRTRTASYAQQAMRIVNMDKWTYDIGLTIKGNATRETVYNYAMRCIDSCYQELLQQGVAVEDARGVLPTNIHTNICVSINMRNWINLIRKRSSARIQNEYRKVVDQMIIAVEKVYPWIHIFVKNDELKARSDLQEMIYANKSLTSEEKVNMVKKLDIIIKDL